MADYDHIVVGGGISGMASAIILAAQGGRVALIEAAPDLSPTVSGFFRKGLLFDTGVHYLGGLGNGAPLQSYFQHLGIADRVEVSPCSDLVDRIFFGESGRKYEIPSGFDKVIKCFKQWFPQDKAAIDRYFDAIKDVLNASPFLNFTKKFDWGNVQHTEGGTLGEFIESITSNEYLKKLFCYHNFFYGVPPSEAQFSTHASVAGTFYLSTHRLAGGGLSLVRACKERLKELGVTLLCGHPVTSIEMSPEQKVTGVKLRNDELLRTSSCVWTAHPKELIKAVPRHAFRPAFCKRITNLQDTPSAVMLYGISQKPIPELEGCNMFLWGSAGYEKDLNGDSSIEECTIFISSSEKQKDGRTAVTAIAPQAYSKWKRWADSRHGARPVDYLLKKQKCLDTLKAEIHRRAPGLFTSVEFVDGSTPLTFKHYCRTPTGSLYGLKHSVNQFNPAPITKAKGLVVAGQSVVAPGIFGAIVSAYLACGIIVGHETLHRELRRCV